MIDWNYTAGNSLEKNLIETWGDAALAVERYGDYLTAVANIQKELNSLTNSTTSPNIIGDSKSYDNKSKSIVDQMKANSLAHVAADANSQEKLHQQNVTLANELASITGGSVSLKNGAWYLNDDRLYTLDKNEIAKAIVSKMKANSNSWSSVKNNPSALAALEANQQELANRLKTYGVNVVRGGDGVWYIDREGGEKLYEKYHTGGIAGNKPSIKDDEIMALLKRDELILTEQQKENAYSYIDFGTHMAEKFGIMADKLSSLSLPKGEFGGIGTSQSVMAQKFDSNIIPNNTDFDIDFNVDVHTDGNTDEKTAKRIGRNVTDGALERLNEVFGRRGMNSLTGSMLRA